MISRQKSLSQNLIEFLAVRSWNRIINKVSSSYYQHNSQSKMNLDEYTKKELQSAGHQEEKAEVVRGKRENLDKKSRRHHGKGHKSKMGQNGTREDGPQDDRETDGPSTSTKRRKHHKHPLDQTVGPDHEVERHHGHKSGRTKALEQNERDERQTEEPQTFDQPKSHESQGNSENEDRRERYRKHGKSSRRLEVNKEIEGPTEEKARSHSRRTPKHPRRQSAIPRRPSEARPQVPRELDPKEGKVSEPSASEVTEEEPPTEGRRRTIFQKARAFTVAQSSNIHRMFKNIGLIQRRRPTDAQDESTTESSDLEEKLWTGPEVYKDELDEEWLGIDRENRSLTQKSVVQKRSYLLSPTSKLELGCHEFMQSTKYLWWWLQIGGRMPFKIYIEDRVVKFRLNKCSFSFIYFAITTFFLTAFTTMMGVGLIKIFVVPSTRVFNIDDQIQRLEIDKYGYYAVVTFFTSVIASSWSLATAFDDGFILADYMTRWNIAISTTKYRPVANVKKYFWINALVYIIYTLVILILFARDYHDYDKEKSYTVPAVRGTAGLIGLAICYPFSHHIRFSVHFPRVEFLGLFVHLYSLYATRSLLMLVSLYSRVLINTARKWNLRLAYVVGMLGGVIRDEKVVAVISFKKLFTEHVILTSFLRHTGKIFTTALGIFYVTKMAELLMLIYRAMSLLIFPLPTFNETYVTGTPTYLNKISYTDPPGLLFGTAFFFLFKSVAEWLITSEEITTCGDTILNGFSFIRRFGLILSKTTQRRRFVQSLNHAFSEASDYYVRAGFTINRRFVFDTFFWLASFAALLTAFSPFQLQRDITSVCNERGECVLVQRTRIAWTVTGGPRQAAAMIQAEMKRVENLVSTPPSIVTRKTRRTRPTRMSSSTTMPTTISSTSTTTKATIKMPTTIMSTSATTTASTTKPTTIPSTPTTTKPTTIPSTPTTTMATTTKPTKAPTKTTSSTTTTTPTTRKTIPTTRTTEMTIPPPLKLKCPCKGCPPGPQCPPGKDCTACNECRRRCAMLCKCRVSCVRVGGVLGTGIGTTRFECLREHCPLGCENTCSCPQPPGRK